MRSSPILHKPKILQEVIIFTPGKKLGPQQVFINVSGNVFLNKNGPKNLCSRQGTPNGDFLEFISYVKILMCPIPVILFVNVS